LAETETITLFDIVQVVPPGTFAVSQLPDPS
jgi:hypothetical protein